MGKKRERPTGFKKVTCSRCGSEAVSTPGKSHRWCKGDKSKRKTVPGNERGTWQ